ncbi:MAG: nucleotidyltransferase family protein [Cyclobacteriaceae bacterium]|nr:nucleotidyltransferase family protein [Cytophagales bacterium]MBX2901800.1 nucleotidyltransferase family protein [Cyclobacteriaceae bacterium]
METGIILLAAGNSSRLGQSKQLIHLQGVPLLRKCAVEALKTTCPVMVVLGANAAAHQAVLTDLQLDSIVNTTWQSGMGNSLKAGLAALLSKLPGMQAVMILVCDQPYLSANHLTNLLTAAQTHSQPIVASAYAGTVGVPVLFKKDFFEVLLHLPNHAGARKILEQSAQHVYSLPFDKGEIDLDTPQDLLHLPG